MAANPKTKNPEPAGGDQSMEEILQSIRKIIAEENDNPPAVSAGDIDVAESDVLELTDAVQDDGSVVNLEDDGDVFSRIDSALSAPDLPEPEPEVEAEPEPEPAPKPVKAAAPKPAPRKAAPQPVSEDDGLVSRVSIAASAEAMRALRHSSAGGFGAMPFVSGDTVEGLVMHLLRPMLKDWLDANLPAIVQQEVQREVQRVSASLEE
ncbi:MAG: DUF2497 domain-containing protein [Alphaproteobacteria bacterium]|nr:DUF2497 domain-containing protein [Alphaproteobacteria bacterium]